MLQAVTDSKQEVGVSASTVYINVCVSVEAVVGSQPD